MDQIWRIGTAAVVIWGVLRAVGLLRAGAPWRTAQWIIALAVPTLSINLLRGQWELIMFAVLLHATVDVATGRMRRAGLLLALAIALKPLALVPALLFAATRPGVRIWLALGVVVALAVPFLHPDPGFVADQYVAMVSKLATAAEPDSGRWFELTMLARAIGLDPGYEVMTGFRLVAAVAILLVALRTIRRCAEPEAAMTVLLLGCAYLVLCNPRTEEGSYANIAILVGWFMLRDRKSDRLVAMIIDIVLIFALGTHFYGDWIYRPTETWIKQVATLAFLGLRLAQVLRHRPVMPTGAPTIALE